MPGLAGSVWLVGPIGGGGTISVLPVADVLKEYVLPTIVALAFAANARDKAATKNEARILMKFPFQWCRVADVSH